MEPYQPIYDAVRSRLSNGDIGEAVQAAFRDANLSHYAMQAAESVRQAAAEYERPSVVFRPTLSFEDNVWCALYGEDLQSGISAFGASPAEAMRAFDVAWHAKTRVV